MDKRTFLKLGLSGASFLALGGLGTLLKPKTQLKRLTSGEAYEVGSAETLALPKSPKAGDHVFIKVSRNGLLKTQNSKIVYEKERLLGLSEDLELDQLANIKLVYGGAQNGWRLTA